MLLFLALSIQGFHLPNSVDDICAENTECVEISTCPTFRGDQLDTRLARVSHCGFSGSLPMVCCALMNSTYTQLQTDQGFSVSDLDLRDGEVFDGPLCNGVICVYEDGSKYSDVP